MRNVFKSLPEPIACKAANPRLISIVNADANWRIGSSGIWTTGMRGGALQHYLILHANWLEIIIACRQLCLGTIDQWVLESYLWIKVWALDHKNKTASTRIEMWQTRVSRWYSSNSKKIQIAVATPSTPADIFLFLHKRTSAAAIEDYY